MNIQRFFTQTSLALSCVAVLASVSTSGCGANGQEPSKADDSAKLNTAKQARDTFDKVHGDYNALSAEDKAAYVKLLGGDKAATDLWNTMKASATPPTPVPSGPASGPPGTTTGPR